MVTRMDEPHARDEPPSQAHGEADRTEGATEGAKRLRLAREQCRTARVALRATLGASSPA